MPEQDPYSATSAVQSVAAPAPMENPVAISFPLMILTWITFIIVTLILYRVAWKPILRALAAREEKIRQSLADAEKARGDAAASEARQQQMLREAETEGRRIVDAARASALETARTIEGQTREQTKALMDNARREIGIATDKARMELRQETAQLAIDLASRLVEENLDAPKNRALVEKIVKEI